MEIDAKSNKIIEQLEELNTQIKYQDSIKRTFARGIVYGFGFFFGSVIIATIAFGVLSPWFGQIDWVRNNFERGASFK